MIIKEVKRQINDLKENIKIDNEFSTDNRVNVIVEFLIKEEGMEYKTKRNVGNYLVKNLKSNMDNLAYNIKKEGEKIRNDFNIKTSSAEKITIDKVKVEQAMFRG